MSQSLKEQYASSPLFGSNASAVEALYEQYLDDPDSVPERWRSYFGELTPDAGGEVAHGPIREAFRQRAAAGSGAAGHEHNADMRIPEIICFHLHPVIQLWS